MTWPALHDAQRAVLREVLVHGSRSRADLARRVGLSRASLTRLTRDLVELGLVAEGETRPLEGRGRPSEMLRLRPEAAHFVGIKLTGEALYAAVTDLHAEVIATEERPLSDRSVDAVVELMVELVGMLRVRFPRLSAVGICLAGDVEMIRGRSVVVGSHFLGWEAVELQLLVEREVGIPVTVDNDVQALTMAHHWFGAGVGCHSLAVVGFGAGIGAGIVVSENGPGCDRGHPGCVSAYATMPALLRNAGAASLVDAIASAEGGDATAMDALERAGRALGVVVATLADLIDPEKIIITGEGLAVARFSRSSLEDEVVRRLDPASERVHLELQDFAFTDYAWAAAISAIRNLV
jgi:predicted NBD/HSP70 family sugar kinase